MLLSLLSVLLSSMNGTDEAHQQQMMHVNQLLQRQMPHEVQVGYAGGCVVEVVERVGGLLQPYGVGSVCHQAPAMTACFPMHVLSINAVHNLCLNMEQASTSLCNDCVFPHARFDH